MDVRRDYPIGGRGTTPQDTFAILNGTSVVGRLDDFAAHEAPQTRVDDVMGRPAVAADPGYFRDDSMLLVINGAVARMQPDSMRRVPSAKTIGDYDPESDF